jgi:hypothetical protein
MGPEADRWLMFLILRSGPWRTVAGMMKTL